MQFCSAISFNHESACVGELAVRSQLILRGWIYCQVKQPFFFIVNKMGKILQQECGKQSGGYNKNAGIQEVPSTKSRERKGAASAGVSS
jgi:hypothetical protein